MTRSPYTDRVLAPLADCLTDDVVRRLVALRVPPDLQSRLEELAAGKTAGKLTSHESDEYHDYIDAIDAVGMIQAQAWRVLHHGRG